MKLTSPPRTLNLSRNKVLATLALILALALAVWLNYMLVVPIKNLSVSDVGNDFSIFWGGAKASWQGGSPYDNSDGSIYRRVLTDTGGQGDVYLNPYFNTLLFLPFSFFPLGLAAALWTTCEQVFLVLVVLMIIRLAGRNPTPLSLLAGVGLAMLVRYSFLVMLVGNLTFLMLFLITASYYCSVRGRPYLAGGLAAVLLIKPQVVFLVLPLLLLIPTEHNGVTSLLNRTTYRRWAGFAVVTAVLLLYSFARLPDWPRQWLDATSGRFGGQVLNSEMPSLRGLIAYFLSDGAGSAILLGSILVAIPFWLVALWFWWRNRYEVKSFAFILAVAICLNLITTPYSREYDSGLLLFPLLYCLFVLPLVGLRQVSFTVLIWTVAFLPYPIHFLALGVGYFVELIVMLAVLVVTLLVWYRYRGSVRLVTFKA